MLYNQPLSRRFGTDLIALISSGNWSSVDIAVAWVRESGLRHLQPALKDFLQAGGELRLVVGVDLDNTSKEGLAGLLALESLGSASTFVNHNESGAVFHPKLYLFRRTGSAKLIVASNNITEAGLYRNTEAGLQVDCKSSDPLVADVIGAIDDWCDTTTGVARRLDPILLKQLEDSGYVKSEVALRQAMSQRRSSSRKPGTAALFGSVNYTAPSPLNSAPPTKNTKTAAKKSSSQKSAIKAAGGSVLIMRIRTARGTQTQMPMPVIASAFFNGHTSVRSLHDGVTRGVHEARANGKVNTLKLEIPETASMQDPMIRFERTASGIQYQVWDKNTPQGKAIWSSLNGGLRSSPPSTFLTKPSTPTRSTWWRFI